MPNYYVVCPGPTGSCIRHEASDFSSYLENTASYFLLCDSTGVTCERSPQNEFINSFSGDQNTYLVCTQPVTGGCSSYTIDGFSALFTSDGYTLPGMTDPTDPTDPGDTTETIEISELVTILESIGEFNVADVAMIISIYLVFFAMGIAAGEVVRLMKRA